MQTTEMTTAQIAQALQQLNGRDGRVREHQGFILIDDGAVYATYANDQAQRLLEVWTEYVERGDEDAYSFACNASIPLQDADLPAEVLQAFKAWLGYDEDRQLNTWI